MKNHPRITIVQQALAPKWEKAASILKEKGIKVGAVDATVSASLAQKYGVKGYPTIKLFSAGPKENLTPKDYNQAREIDAIVDFAIQTFEESANAAGPVTVSQLTGQGVFDQTCGKAKLCGGT